VIEIRLGADDVPAGAPLVCASEVGYSPLGALLAGDARAKIAPFADWIRYSSSGAYVALIDSPPAPRPLGLIQTDRGPFYRQRHSRRDVVWRDFYYATVYAVLSAMDDRWSASDVELAHPTGYGWPQDLVIVVQEVLRHLDVKSTMSLRRVHFTCLHDLDQARLDAAARVLDAEWDEGRPAESRPLAVVPVDVSAVNAPAPLGSLMLHIVLPDAPTDS